MPQAFPVQVIAIPDGLHDGRLRISLSLTPFGDAPAYAPRVEISRWPEEVGRLSAGLRLAVADIAGGLPINPRYISTPLNWDLEGTGYPGSAGDDWRRVFESEPGGFDALARYLNATEAGPEPPQTIAGRASNFDFYSSAELGGMLRSLYTAVGERALRLRSQHQANDALAAGSLNAREWQAIEELAPWSGGDPVGLFNRDKPLTRLARIQSKRQALAETALARGVLTSSTNRAATAQLADLTAITLAEFNALNGNEVRLTTNGQGYVLGLPSSDEAKDVFTRYAAAWGLVREDCPDPSTCVDPPCDPPIDTDPQKSNAARKFSGILSYPTLAKYFGLITDLYVDSSAIGPAGALAVVFADAAPADPGQLLTWTAFSRQGEWFGPAEARGDTSTDKGLVNLREQISRGRNSVPRYVLSQVDATNGTKRLLDRAVAVGEGLRSGLPLDEVGSTLPDLHETGIALLDRKSAATAFAARLERRRMQPGMATSELQLNYSEHLRRGIRIDVAMSDADGNLSLGDATRWRTLMARALRFGIDPQFLGLDAVRRVSARDDGFVGEAESMRSIGGALSIDVPQEVATWTGESLAVPVNGNTPGCETIWIDPATDLAISIDFSLPQAGVLDLRPSLLRYGRGYRFGARLCFLNGCGLTFSEARARYVSSDASMVLGDENAPREPFSYKRLRKVQAPEVLLPWNEALTTEPTEAPGETIDTLVVRSGRVSTPQARRFLVPSRLAADQAEQHGQFDDSEGRSSPRPRGAFRGLNRAELDRGRGSFPVARDGDWQFPESEGEGAPAREVSQGLVLVLNRSAPATEQEYHADPLGRAVQAKLIDVDGQNSGITPPVEFWSTETHAREAQPIMLELKRAGAGGAGGSFDLNDHHVIVRPQGGGSLRLPKLSVALAPAEVMDIELNPSGDSEALCRELGGLDKAIERAGLTRVAGGALLLEGATDPWIGARRLRLVHAVEQPLAPLSLTRLHPVVVSVVSESATTGRKWSDYLASVTDPLTLASEEGGATTFFVGAAAFHRKSTGQLRCEAAWTEHGPAGLRRNNEIWSYAPPENSARLFGISNIDARGPNRIDLARDDRQPRGLSHSFPDGRARLLDAQLVATSRFTDYYRGGASDRHERRSQPVRVIIPCTFRPPLPEIDRVMPTMHWSNRINARRTTFEFTRTCGVRVFLKPSIYASGADEMLGLVFWTRGGSTGTLCDFEAATGQQGQRVTQWGYDPIQNPLLGAGILPTLPQPSAFSGWDAEESELLLPAPDLEDGAAGGGPDNQPLPVHVLGFEPRIDPVDGPYCDIAADVGTAYAPFVRLGLVRYQPHAVAGLELSRPVSKTAQILPWRVGNVRIRRQRQVEVTLRGPGYSGRRVSGLDEDPRGSTLLNVRLMRAVSRVGQARSRDFPPTWRPVLDENGAPIEIIAQPPQAVDGQAVWTCAVTLPRSRRRVHYGLAIEELEWLDSEDAAASSACLAVGASPSPNPQPRGPIFAHIVDLDPDLPLGRAPVDQQSANREPLSMGEDGLVGTAREAARLLRERFPEIVFTSGRRDVARQARAMAHNVTLNRRWVVQTYRRSAQRDALQQWLDENPSVRAEGPIAEAFATIMSAWSPPMRARFSKHFSGLAFDIRPLAAPGARSFIRALPGLTNFLEREGGLTIWHLEFQPGREQS